MMRLFILVGAVCLLLSGCGFGFGSSDDEALEATVDYREPVDVQVPAETMGMLKEAFSFAVFENGKREETVASLGGLKLMFEFMNYKVTADKRLSYATFKVGVEFIEWVYLVKLSGILDPMVMDGALAPKDSLLYYYVSKDIRTELNHLTEVIYLAEKDIRGKATANDEQRLRDLYKTLSPYINMLKAAI